MRRTAVLIVLPILALTACGGDEAEPEPETATLADVTVAGGFGEEPEIDFNSPIVFEETESEVLEEGPGKGVAVSPESTVTIDYVGVVARDGTTFADSWDAGQPATFDISQVIPGLVEGLSGAREGDRVLVGVTSKDGFDPTGNGESIIEGDSLVFVVDVLGVESPVPLTMANFPQLDVDDQGNPTGFSGTDAQNVPELMVKVLEEGDGPAVKASDTVTAEYLGQVFPDGPVFDESYSADEPRSFGLDSVIEGWTEGLVGQKVGSRVVLAIPSELGYGEQGSQNIPPNADLIFVVDIEKVE